MPNALIVCGDARKLPFADESVNCCVTSPPYYGLRNYQVDGQVGLEQAPEAYVAEMVKVFREVKRVLRHDGTLWLNLGDSYAANRSYQVNSLKPKDLIGIPWMVAFALRADGWWLRQDIIWAKGNPMPESVTDRCTKSHEYLFLLSKSKDYYFDHVAIKEDAAGVSGGSCFGKQGVDADGTGAQQRQYERPVYAKRNKRSVWNVNPKPYKGAHFATFPPKLIEPCILAGCPEKVCEMCGEPWRRRMQKPSMPTVDASGVDRFGDGSHGVHRKVGQAYQDWRDKNPDADLGFHPGCRCIPRGVPGTVLDPFMGSGTTAEVALSHGRNAVGTELNQSYIKLCHERLAKLKPVVKTTEMGMLFDVQ